MPDRTGPTILAASGGHFNQEKLLRFINCYGNEAFHQSLSASGKEPCTAIERLSDMMFHILWPTQWPLSTHALCRTSDFGLEPGV